VNRFPNDVLPGNGEGYQWDDRIGEELTENAVSLAICGGQHTREGVLTLVREKGTP
jgi:hypothetical protein